MGPSDQILHCPRRTINDVSKTGNKTTAYSSYNHLDIFLDDWLLWVDSLYVFFLSFDIDRCFLMGVRECRVNDFAFRFLFLMIEVWDSFDKRQSLSMYTLSDIHRTWFIKSMMKDGSVLTSLKRTCIFQTYPSKPSSCIFFIWIWISLDNFWHNWNVFVVRRVISQIQYINSLYQVLKKR